MYNKMTAGKLIGRTPAELFEHAIIGGKSQFHSFPVTLTWIAVSETTLTLVHNDVAVKEGSTYNDFYGYLTSITQNESYDSEVERYKINDKSTLEARLTTTILLTPYLEDDEGLEWNKVAFERKMKYKLNEVPRSYLHKMILMDSDTPNVSQYRPISSIELDMAIIRSSFNTDADNALLEEAFIKKWSNPADINILDLMNKP